MINYKALISVIGFYLGLGSAAFAEEQKLLTFNVGLDSLTKIFEIADSFDVPVGETYSPLAADVVVYVLNSKNEVSFLPSTFTGSKLMNGPTTAFSASKISVPTNAGAHFTFTMAIAIRDMAPELSNDEFDCNVVRLTTASLLSKGFGDNMTKFYDNIGCD